LKKNKTASPNFIGIQKSQAAELNSLILYLHSSSD